MNVLLVLSSRESGPIATGLIRALDRAGAHVECFFTNDGVALLNQPEFVAVVARTARAVACQHSWDIHGAGDCPVERGSQTIHSSMIGEINRVISL
jgi:hypothetical protein